MNAQDTDLDVAKVLLSYLGKATLRYAETSAARDHYEADRQALAHQGAEEYYTELARAKARLHQMLGKEKALLQEHEAQELVARDLRDKMDIIAKRLERVLVVKKTHKSRVKDLNRKVEGHYTKRKSVSTPDKRLRELELLLDSLSHAGGHAKKVAELKKRISQLKKHMR